MFQLTLTALASGEHSAPANRTTPTQRVLLGFHVPDLSIPSFLLENNPITLVGSVRFPSLPFLLLFALAARHSFAFGCLSLLCNTHTRYRYHRLSFLCIPIQEPGNRLEVPAAEERIHSFIHSFIHSPTVTPARLPRVSFTGPPIDIRSSYPNSEKNKRLNEHKETALGTTIQGPHFLDSISDIANRTYQQ
jgi:hypothetical protein